MDFSFTEEQSQIRELTRRIFADHCSDDFHARFHKSQQVADRRTDYPHELWKLMADSGLLGLALPETHGGSGFGILELCLMLEEQGRYVAPVPLLPALVYGGLTVSRFGSDEQKGKYLPSLATGQLLLTAAIAEASMAQAMRSTCNATQDSGTWRLNGQRVAVPYALQSAAVLVPADTAQGEAVFLVTPQEGMQCCICDSSNHEPLYSITFQNARAELLGTVEQGAEILDFILQHGAIACAATMVGITEEATRRTAQYTGERKQFDTPIASFQNTTMKMADCYIDIEALRSSYYEALWKLSEGMACKAEVNIAKYWACAAGHRVTHTCQHLHGGIGADVEYPLHRYYLWFKQMDLTLGGGTRQLADLGQLMAEDDSIQLLTHLA